MEDARPPLPPVTAVGATPRGTTPHFVRNSLQKLRADTSRRYSGDASAGTTLDGERWPSAPPAGAHSAELRHTVQFSAGHLAPVATPRTPEDSARPHDNLPVRDRGYLNGFLTHDLERYREAFAEELRAKLQAVQEALQQANVAGLAEQVMGRLDRFEVQGQETEKLRTQCTDLLRLNTQLRQQQIDSNSSHLRNTAEKISAMVTTLDAWEGVDMDAVERAMGRALEPLKQGQQNMQVKLKRVESCSCDLVAEFRKMLREELEPLKNAQQALHSKLKRMEGLDIEASRERVVLKEEMERLLDVHARKMGSMQLIPRAGGGAEAVMQGGVDSADLTEAICDLKMSTRDLLASVSEDRAKVFANQGKMVLDLNEMAESLQAIQSSVGSVQGSLEKVADVVEEVPSAVAKQMTSLETVEEAEVRRLRQQLASRNAEIAGLRQKFDANRSVVPFLSRIQAIERRGNLRIDLKNGEVTLDKEIMFKAKRQSEPPVAEFANEGDALEIIADVAELWDNFRVDMAIEGHTKGGENDFWQELATNRAALVARRLQEMGVQKERLHPEGLPGMLGKNIVAVDVKLDIFPDLN